ncbi:hypothetical protein D7V97_13500 [Corallococcus sp. CA053C]|nr:hypothetical protein D7V97_13500 [Corallococcus sp. CA053C]
MPPVIPEGYTLLTPSETEVHAVPWNEDTAQPLRFAFVARAGRHYDFIVEAGSEGYVLELRDAAGMRLDYEIDRDYAPREVFSVRHWSGFTENAVYTVDVHAYYFDARGPFSFRLVDTGPDDHADLYGTAAPWVPSEQPLTGLSEHYKERDLHSFQTVAGNVYALACTFPTTSWQLAIFNRQEQHYGFAEGPLFEDLTQGSTAFKSPGGVFYTDVQDLGTSTTPYSCVLRDMGAEDHGDTVETATALPAGTASVQAKIEVLPDKDVFALGVLPRHHYRVSCTIDGKKMCEVASAAPGGAFSHSTSDRTWTTFKASEATHHVRVAINPILPTLWEEGHYTLQFEDLGEDDHGDTLATATPLTGPVQAVTGRIPDTVDHDFFSFQATAGQRYQFGCDWNSAPGQEQFYATFRDAQGEQVSTSWEHVGERWVHTYTAPRTATYSIDLYSGSPRILGDYTCEFRVLDP